MNAHVSDRGACRAKIVVGVDGSQASRAALRWALFEARSHGLPLEAVIAWRPAVALAGSAARPSAGTRTLEEQRADAHSVLVRTLSAESCDGVSVASRAARGSPHRVLLDAARGAQMLVIGGRSKRVSARLPWSTGQQLVRDAACPLVVVPPDG